MSYISGESCEQTDIYQCLNLVCGKLQIRKTVIEVSKLGNVFNNALEVLVTDYESLRTSQTFAFVETIEIGAATKKYIARDLQRISNKNLVLVVNGVEIDVFRLCNANKLGMLFASAN